MSFGEASSSPRITHAQPHTGIAAGLSICILGRTRTNAARTLPPSCSPCSATDADHGATNRSLSRLVHCMPKPKAPPHQIEAIFVPLAALFPFILLNLGAISVSSTVDRSLLLARTPCCLSSAPTHWARSPHQLFPANSSTPPSPGLNHAHESRSPSPSIRQGCSIDDHFAQRPGAACGKQAARALHSFVCVC